MTRFFTIILFSVFVLMNVSAFASDQWEVLPQKSKITFKALTTFHDVNGQAREISGTLEQKLNATKGFVDVTVTGLTTSEKDCDKNMYQMFDAGAHKFIHFNFDVTGVSDVLAHHDGEIIFSGTMTIHNISHPVTFMAKARMSEGELICDGSFRIHLKDYKLKPPSIIGLIRVKDEVNVQYSIDFMKKEIH